MKYKRQKETTDFSVIADSVCEYFEVNDKLDIFKQTRKREVITQRQWFHYFARTLNPEHIVSSSTIGAYYSDLTGHAYDHATILHSVRKIKGYIDVSRQDREIKKDINLLINIKLNANYKSSLTGNCAEQPFKITRYYDTKKPTPASFILPL